VIEDIWRGKKYKFIACGWYTNLAIDTDDYLFVNGRNNYGQLGLVYVSDSGPRGLVQVDRNKYKAVAGGEGHTLALRTNGILYATGLGGDGQLGLGDTGNRSILTKVSNDIFVEIAAGGRFSAAKREDGAWFVWGLNDKGQLGLGDNVNRNVPTLLPLPPGVDQIENLAAGAEHVLAEMKIADEYKWYSGGSNSHGQLLNGSSGGSVNTLTPTNIPQSASSDNKVDAWHNSSSVIKSDGTANTGGNIVKYIEIPDVKITKITGGENFGALTLSL
jgi:alpha-tubulin suppressor-like RCC1 family protein